MDPMIDPPPQQASHQIGPDRTTTENWTWNRKEKQNANGAKKRSQIGVKKSETRGDEEGGAEMKYRRTTAAGITS